MIQITAHGDVATLTYQKLLALKVDKCPFANLPINGTSRWSQGITPADMQTITWAKPELVAQVKFTEWTGEGRLRQPLFLGLREDKAAGEVRKEKA